MWAQKKKTTNKIKPSRQNSLIPKGRELDFKGCWFKT